MTSLTLDSDRRKRLKQLTPKKESAMRQILRDSAAMLEAHDDKEFWDAANSIERQIQWLREEGE